MDSPIPAAPRKLRHTRTVTMTGWEREDGLWDVEARLCDIREDDLSEARARGAVPRRAGEPIHLMTLRLTLRDDFTIVAVETFSHQIPYTDCAQAGPAYQRLVGLKVEPGFNQVAKKLFKGAVGCTHLSELIAPLATCAFQTIRPGIELRREERGEPPTDDGPKPLLLDSCHGLRRGGEAAVIRWGEIGK